jgi:hypothetical protein
LRNAAQAFVLFDDVRFRDDARPNVPDPAGRVNFHDRTARVDQILCSRAAYFFAGDWVVGSELVEPMLRVPGRGLIRCQENRSALVRGCVLEHLHFHLRLRLSEFRVARSDGAHALEFPVEPMLIGIDRRERRNNQLDHE